MRFEIVMGAAVTAIALAVLSPPPAQAYPICVCSKKDPPGTAQPRCGDALKITEGPGGTYELNEIRRGWTALSTDEYKVCNPDACTALKRKLEESGEQHPEPSSDKCPVPDPQRQPPPPEERFAISGSATIGTRLVPRLITGYANAQDWRSSSESCDQAVRLAPADQPSHPALTIDCRAQGSNAGIPDLEKGDAEIAMLSRPITPSEIAGMRERGYPHITTALQEHVLALDGIAVVVSDRNPDSALKLAEIRAIFETPHAERNYYLLDERSGTRAIFESMMFADGKDRLPSCDGANVRCFSDPQEVVRAVAGDRRGIGFVGSAYKDAPGVKSVAVRGDCGVTQEPSIFDIKTEDYLFSRQLLLYTAKVRSLQAAGFLFYAMSDNAQPIIENAGYVSQTVSVQSPADAERRLLRYQQQPPAETQLDHDSKAMADLHNTLKGAARLSISFRFRSDSTAFDTRAVQDLQRLADYLTFDDKGRNDKVVLAGFTDAAGDFRANVDLSLNRARAVAGALQATGIEQHRISTIGASELMPVACNDTDLGRGKNRRVEVWVRP